MKLDSFEAQQLVFIDESGINAKLGQRTHGYSKKGKVIPYKVIPGRAENFSLLPAMSCDGYIACNLYRGAVTGERFETFIKEYVLPQCSPWPGPRSVIVMDNASIHREEVSFYANANANANTRLSVLSLNAKIANSNSFRHIRRTSILSNTPSR